MNSQGLVKTLGYIIENRLFKTFDVIVQNIEYLDHNAWKCFDEVEEKEDLIRFFNILCPRLTVRVYNTFEDDKIDIWNEETGIADFCIFALKTRNVKCVEQALELLADPKDFFCLPFENFLNNQDMIRCLCKKETQYMKKGQSYDHLLGAEFKVFENKIARTVLLEEVSLIS